MTALPPSGIGAFLALALFATVIAVGAVIHHRIDQRVTRNRRIARLRQRSANERAEFERECAR